MSFTFDQVHLGVPDPAAAARWYVDTLGATPGDHTDRIWFGPTRVIFLKNPSPAPSAGGAIDHFALACADVAAEAAALARAGVRAAPSGAPGPGAADASPHEAGRMSRFVEDPWGTRIQLVEAAGGPRFHHVHLRVPDPAAARAWYLERFGGTAGSYEGRVDGIRYGDVWVLLEGGSAEPSRGRAIDHVGWRVADLMRAAEGLARQGLTFTTAPQAGPPGPFSPVLLSFAEDPWGVKIELLQRRPETGA